MPNIKSLALVIFEIWTAQYFGSYFEYEGGATWGPHFNQFVSLLVCTYMLNYMTVSQIWFLLSHRQESVRSDSVTDGNY